MCCRPILLHVEYDEEGSPIVSAARESEQVYTYSEARQKLSSVLDNAEVSGKVLIRREDGRTFALAPDSEYLYMTGSPWQVDKRRLPDGELVWNQIGDPGKSYCIVVHGDAMYLVGRTSGQCWSIAKRVK